MVIFLLFIYSYPTRPDQQILKKLNLTLPPGKTVAIVGESGGGIFFINDCEHNHVASVAKKKSNSVAKNYLYLLICRKVHNSILARAFL